MYIRFQTGIRCHDTGRSLGIFHAAGSLEDNHRTATYLLDPLKETLHWFNDNLPVPNHDSIDNRCLFWFDCNNSQVIGRVWDLITWLQIGDVYVAKFKSADPGKILYRDLHQVAAIPSLQIRRQLGLR